MFSTLSESTRIGPQPKVTTLCSATKIPVSVVSIALAPERPAVSLYSAAASQSRAHVTSPVHRGDRDGVKDAAEERRRGEGAFQRCGTVI